jgi:hypothetical protein
MVDRITDDGMGYRQYGRVGSDEQQQQWIVVS